MDRSVSAFVRSTDETAVSQWEVRAWMSEKRPFAVGSQRLEFWDVS